MAQAKTGTTPSPSMGEGRGEGDGTRKYINRARQLRQNMTDVEKALWRQLRNNACEGAKFRRQQPIGPYIVDFVCYERKTIIELDGGQHAEQIKYNTKRDIFFKSQGYRVLRFWNNEMLENSEGVMTTIYNALSESNLVLPLTLTLPHKGRGDFKDVL